MLKWGVPNCSHGIFLGPVQKSLETPDLVSSHRPNTVYCLWFCLDKKEKQVDFPICHTLKLKSKWL